MGPAVNLPAAGGVYLAGVGIRSALKSKVEATRTSVAGSDARAGVVQAPRCRESQVDTWRRQGGEVPWSKARGLLRQP